MGLTKTSDESCGYVCPHLLVNILHPIETTKQPTLGRTREILRHARVTLLPRKAEVLYIPSVCL